MQERKENECYGIGYIPITPKEEIVYGIMTTEHKKMKHINEQIEKEEKDRIFYKYEEG